MKLGQGSNGVIIFHSLSKGHLLLVLELVSLQETKLSLKNIDSWKPMEVSQFLEPQLRVAEALIKMKKHVVKNRQFYDKNFQLSEQILKSTKPQGGFFNFIPVENDLHATKHLWENHGKSDAR